MTSLRIFCLLLALAALTRIGRLADRWADRAYRRLRRARAVAAGCREVDTSSELNLRSEL